MSRLLTVAVVALVVVGTVAPAAAAPGSAAGSGPEVDGPRPATGTDGVGPAAASGTTATETTDSNALTLSPAAETTLVPGGNYLFTLTATEALDAPTIRLTTTAASGVEIRTVSAPDSDLSVSRRDATEYVVDSAGRLYADRTILVYVHVDETTAVDELNVTAAVDGGPTVSRSYPVVPRASADSRATLARQARARADMARSYAEMNDTLFADEPVSEAVVAGLLDGFTLVGTEYAKSRILGAAARFVPGLDEFLQAQALGEYASGTSFYHDLFDVVVGILPDTTFDGLDADKGARQGNLANALRRVAHHADAEADAWERGNRSDALSHVREQRARLCAAGQDTYTPGTYHDLEARDYDCVHDEAYDQRDGIDAPHLQNFSVHVRDWATGVDERLTDQVRPRARVSDPAVTTDRDTATVAAALRDLSVGESATVRLRVSNDATVSPRGVLSVSTGNLSVTRVERAGDGTVVDARQYAPGETVNGADGDVVLSHPLAEVTDPYGPGQIRTYRLTVERTDEGDAWLRYRAALEAFAGAGTDGGPTWGRAPAVGTTDPDQQGWPAAAVGVGDEGDEGDGGNDPPTVDAGAGLTVTAGETATLTAAGSDPDGDVLTYDWTQTSGPSVAVGDGATVTVTAPPVDTERTIGLRATVTDADGASASDATTLTVRPADGDDGGDANEAPTADAGRNRTVVEGETVTIDPDYDDPDGDAVDYGWTVASGPAVDFDRGLVYTSFVAPSVETTRTVVVELTVTDAHGASTTDRASITVEPYRDPNEPPVAQPGEDRVVPAGESARLDASSSSDPDAGDGPLLDYQWRQVAGPSAPVVDASAEVTTVEVPVPDERVTLTYEVVVSDDSGATDAARVNLTVPSDDPPTVSVPSSLPSVEPGSSVEVDATTSDPDGDALSHEWSLVAGPAGFSFPGRSFEDLRDELPLPGTYRYRLTVSDGTFVRTANVTVRAEWESMDREPNDHPDEAPATAPGTYDGLRLEDGFQDDYYAVNLTRGDRLDVRVSAADPSAGARVLAPNVTDSDVGIADAQVAPRGGPPYRVPNATVVAERTGTYYVQVEKGVEAPVNYSLSLTRTRGWDDRYEPNDRRSDNEYLGTWVERTARLAPGDADWYGVGAQAGEVITVRAEPTAGDASLDVAIFDGDDGGERLASGPGSLTYRADAFDNFPVRVTGNGPVGYELTMRSVSPVDAEPNDDRSSAVALSPGRYEDLSLEAGGTDVFALRAADGDRLNATVSWVPPGAQVELLGPDGRRLAVDGGAGDDTVASPVATNGTHYLRVTGGTVRSDYVVSFDRERGWDDRFEPNDRPASAEPLTPGNYSLRLAPADEDVFTTSVGADERLRVTATATRPVRVAAKTPDGARTSTTGRNATVRVAPEVGGTVEVGVAGNGSGAVDYRLSVAVVPDGSGNDTAGPIAAFDVDPGTDVAPGTALTLDASNATAPAGIDLYEWDFDGDGRVDTRAADPVVSHAYDAAGEYALTLRVVDEEGRRDVLTRTVVVDDGGDDGDGDTPGTATVVDGFEDGDVSEWTRVVAAETTTRNVYAGDRSLRLEDTDANMNGRTGNRLYRNFSTIRPDRLQAAARIDGSYYNDIRVNWRNETNHVAVGFNLDNYRSGVRLGNAGRYDSLVAGTWYRVVFDDIDWDAHTVGTVRVDGEVVDENVSFTHPVDGVSVVSASVNSGGTGDYGAIDNVTVGANATAGNAPPTPTLDVDPATPTVGERVTVDASNATDPDGTVTGYDWTFAGPTEPAPSPDSPAVVARTYADPGRYDVTLAVTDDDGATATTTRTVTVEGAAPPAKPDTTGTSTGDPHLTTFDGLAYDFQAAGEFVLVREAGGSFEVQARQVPVAGADDVTVNAALATRLDGRRVTIDARDATPLHVDGDPVAVNATAPATVGDGRVYHDGASTYTVVYPGPDGRVDDGDAQVVVDVVDDRVDVAVHVNASRRDDLRGLLGDADGSTGDDLALPDGTTLGRPPAFDALYGPFRDGWLVNGSTTLFDYDDAAGPSTYDRPAVPSSPTTVDDFPDAEVATARSAAAAAGLENGTANFRNAVLDYLLTGDESYFDSARRVPETPAANATVPTNGSATAFESTFDADLDGWTVGYADDARDGTVDWSEQYGGSARLHAGGAPGEVRMSRIVGGLSAGDRIELWYAPERFAYAEAGLTLRLVTPDGETIGLDAENDHSAGREQNGTMVGTVPRAVPEDTRIQLRLRIWPGETTVFVETVTVTGDVDDSDDPFDGVSNPPTDPMPAAPGYEDVDGDGDADFSDVIELLFEVDGYTGPRATVADFDDDGDADFADVIELLFRL